MIADVTRHNGSSSWTPRDRGRIQRRRRCPTQRRPVTEKKVEHPRRRWWRTHARPRCVRVPRLIRAFRDPQHPLPRRKSGDLPTLSHLSHASRPRASSSSPPLPPVSPGRSTEAPSQLIFGTSKTEGKIGEKEKQAEEWSSETEEDLTKSLRSSLSLSMSTKSHLCFLLRHHLRECYLSYWNCDVSG